jgi:peptidoglycan/xylan/chitin deacetylase (PgdA/CDA1 family)
MQRTSHPIAALSGRLPGNLAIRLDAGALCSFTFDDCPSTTLKNAGRILEDVGAGGTFYVSGSLLGSTDPEEGPILAAEDLLELVNHGHELGCHSHAHRSFRELSIAQIRRDLDANDTLLLSASGAESLVSFAYPFGETRWAAKLEVARRFGSARGVRAGINGRLIDLSELRAIAITARGFSLAKLASWVDRAKRRRGWIVFYTHDVAESPGKWGCTPQQFAQVVALVRAAGIEILTVRNALGRVMHRC